MSKNARGWVRRYPPLVTLAVALLIMFVVMPSMLTLPQANPTTVLEYAPIPPEDEDQPPPQDGSLSSLSLGTSDTIDLGGFDDLPLPGAPGVGEQPIVKRCVGDPPRQTEDPNAPPCVPFFTGDNGGSTFRGITGEEVKVVVYHDTHLTTGGDSGFESSPPAGEICDIESEPDDPENIGCMNDEGTKDHGTVQLVRALSRYFNDRFQTYNRHIHFYIYWGGGRDPGGRRSDVQDIFERIGPFAALDYTIFGEAEAFIEAAVKRQISIFGSYASVPNKTYRENAPYLWSFWPDVENQVALFHDYVCKRIAPFPVSHTGNSADAGNPRRIGLLYTTHAAYPGTREFAAQAKQRLQRGCSNGATLDIAGEYTYPRNGFSVDTHPDAITKARENIARMQTDGVTTVLWLGGYETEHSKAAALTGWLPEWVMAGDVQNDQTEEAALQDQRAWRYARVMSNHIREDKITEAPCRMAYREADPYGTPEKELEACALYRSFFMLFRSIQVAGPFLTPESVNQGNHSIARLESTSPYVASCYYDPGDFTCVKDAQESWWDPDVPNPNDDPTLRGCWRMTNGGERFVAGKWSQVDDAFKPGPETICNTSGDNAATINPYGPAG